ncbi:MAG TPA: hypothetical protein VG826_21375 [Pirellulales bacterium]|nr:hypothetical protein [Pirellulales bacterium]
MTKAKKADTVSIDQRTKRGDRRKGDRRTTDKPVAVERRQIERREKVNRRRQIDPTTCEREYTPDEVEFMNALDLYKRKSGRMFPTCSEVLEVIRDLGYVKASLPQATPLPAADVPQSLTASTDSSGE